MQSEDSIEYIRDEHKGDKLKGATREWPRRERDPLLKTLCLQKQPPGDQPLHGPNLILSGDPSLFVATPELHPLACHLCAHPIYIQCCLQIA